MLRFQPYVELCYWRNCWKIIEEFMEEDLKKLLICFVGKKNCEPTKSLVVCIDFLDKNT